MKRTDASGHGNNRFVEEDVNLGRQPTQIDSTWMNSVQEEIATFVEASGQTLNANDTSQMTKAFQRATPIYAEAAGTANAITASFNPAVTQLVDGMTFYVKAKYDNTAKAVTFAPNAMTPKPVVSRSGAQLRIYDIEQNHILELKYLSFFDSWVLQNPSRINDISVGMLLMYTGGTVEKGYILDDGVPFSRTQYPDLADLYLTKSGFTQQSFTVTIASPAVFTKSGNTFTNGERLRLFTSGALPTGLNTSSDYFVEVLDAVAGTFYLCTSESLGSGVRVNTSGTQSGTHNYLQSLYGLGDGSTTCGTPNNLGKFIRRANNTGTGYDAGRAIGSAQKGSIVAIDTNTGTGGEGAFSASTSASTTAASAQKAAGYDSYTTTDYGSMTLSGVTTSTGALSLPGNAGGVATTGIVRPVNTAYLFMIKAT